MAYASRNVREQLGSNPIDSTRSQEIAERRGYFYRTIEEQIDKFAAESGTTDSVADVADWVGLRLRAKAKAIWTQYGDTELLHQMRQVVSAAGNGTGNHSRVGPARPPLHVRASAGSALNPLTGRPMPGNEKRVEQIRKLAAKGFDSIQIAAKMGMSKDNVRQYIRRYNIDAPHAPRGLGQRGRPRGPYKPRDTSRVDMIRKLAAAGMRPSQIAQKVGISAAGVYWNARQHGIPLMKHNTNGRPIGMAQPPKRKIKKASWMKDPAKIKERIARMNAARLAKKAARQQETGA